MAPLLQDDIWQFVRYNRRAGPIRSGDRSETQDE